MEFRALAARFAAIERQSGRHAKRDLLADLLGPVGEDQLGPVLRLARGRVFERWEPGEIGISSTRTLEAIARATGRREADLEARWRELGDLGSAAAEAVTQDQQATLVSRPLTVRRVHDGLRALDDVSGAGSTDRRVGELAGLLSDADPKSAKYLVRIAGGAMRLGIGEGLIRDAIAHAFLDGTESDIAAVKRAYEVTNDFGRVARVAKRDGVDGLADLRIEPFRPIKPMLAQRTEDVETAIADLGDAAGKVLLEVKYDGMRAKVHREGERIVIYTRRLEEVTPQFPDAVAAIEEALEASRAIFEAELVGIDPSTGDPVPFQELSRRIKRKHDIEAVAAEIPVRIYPFDLLLLGDDPLLERPLRDRLVTLDNTIHETSRVERASNRLTDDPVDAQAFLEEARAAGHEGLMVKNLDARYEPGARVGYQRKLKPTLEALDLIVTRAKWSEGRKRGFLGRPYLACRDEDGGFREVGRMHSGFTDEQLERFTELVEPRIEAVEGREARFRPEVVLEVECAEIQRSPTYDSGFALRFPRLRRIREDLGPDDVDTLDRIRAVYRAQAESL